MIAHSSEPPYFTTKAGRPKGKPYQRKDRPHAITASASAARRSDLVCGVARRFACAAALRRTSFVVQGRDGIDEGLVIPFLRAHRASD